MACQQLTPLLYSDRTTYLVVFSLRAGPDRLALLQYIVTISQRCPESCIIVVGTHSDAFVRGEGDLLGVSATDLRRHSSLVGRGSPHSAVHVSTNHPAHHGVCWCTKRGGT